MCLKEGNKNVRKKLLFYAGLPGQVEDEEAMYEVDIPTDTEELGTDQYYSEDSLNIFIGLAIEGDLVRLQRDFYQNYREHKELSQFVWEAMHTTFPITSTGAIVSQLPTGEVGKLLGQVS